MATHLLRKSTPPSIELDFPRLCSQRYLRDGRSGPHCIDDCIDGWTDPGNRNASSKEAAMLAELEPQSSLHAVEQF